MKTLKIEREVTKEDVFVCVANTSEYDEVCRIITAGGEQIPKRPFERLVTYSPLDGYWIAVGSVGDKYQITIPQLAELLGVEYPLKPKFEAGKWYHYNGWLLCYVRHDNSIIRAYGIDLSNGVWWDEDEFGRSDEGWTLAAHAEVKATLIAEARKRGFKAGVEINNSALGFRDQWQKTDGDELVWDGGCLGFGNKGAAIFYNGEWAEVIERKQLPTLEELIAEAKSKITVKTETCSHWNEGTWEIKTYNIGERKYTVEKLAIIGYIAERLREEYL